MGRTKRRSKRVTIRDVAARAGVSVGAASTALSNRPSNVVLSPETRERIRESARVLKYRPLSAARAMAGTRVGRLGVLATEGCLTDPFYAGVLHGIASEVGEQGCRLLLEAVPERRHMARGGVFAEQDIDGVIVMADGDDRMRSALRRYEIQHVWVNTELREPQGCVHVDDVGGAALAVEHLARLGHRRIGFMRHFRGQRRHTTVQRERGYLEGLARHGLEPVPSYNRYLDAADHVDVFLRMKSPPTALVMSSDALAVQACVALTGRGVRVPEDISLVGHDGLGLQEFAPCRLTTVVVPVEEMGRRAVWMLLDQIEQGARVASVVLPESLGVNSSTAPVSRPR